MPARRAATKKRVKGPNGKFQWVPIDDVLPPMSAAMTATLDPEDEDIVPERENPFAPPPPMPERTYFEPWYHPKYRGITLRPSPNESYVLDEHKFVPRTAKEDDYLRHWITRERRGNDPERWHGDTPGMRDLPCPYCKAAFRNQDVYEDHLQMKHLREDLGDERMR